MGIFIACCFKVYHYIISVMLLLWSSNAWANYVLSFVIALKSFLENIFLATKINNHSLYILYVSLQMKYV